MKKLHILLVDDVDFFLEVEKGFLRQTPATIATVRNGLEALQSIAGHRPDLIYMDLNMPEMDGADCCKTLKADPDLRSIPVIMVLAADSQADIDTCWQAGCDGVLTKPVDKRSFLALGHNFLFQIDRREKRVRYEMEVEFHLAGGAYRGTTVNLSETGLYIHSRQEVRMNELARVIFSLKGQTVEIRGRIVWVNQGFPRADLGLPQGFGFVFHQIDPAAAGAMRDLLAEIGGG
jgi:CheY-like chemotaxis protein